MTAFRLAIVAILAAALAWLLMYGALCVSRDMARKQTARVESVIEQ
jgi:hypothetical protein